MAGATVWKFCMSVYFLGADTVTLLDWFDQSEYFLID